MKKLKKKSSYQKLNEKYNTLFEAYFELRKRTKNISVTGKDLLIGNEIDLNINSKMF
jgi:hypothetical protein